MMADVVSTLSALVAAGAASVATYFTWTLRRNSTDQLKRMRQIERAYLVGGGECQIVNGVIERNSAGQRLFRVEVGNHGKTPARMEEFEIEFCTQIEATGQPRPTLPHRTHNDQFPPGDKNRPIGPLVPIVDPNDDVAFGAVHYRDIWGDPHFSLFILRIDQAGHTHSDMIGVDSYRGYDPDPEV